MTEIYQPTDIVLAKVKGFPPWPAMIIPRELIPENVWKTRSRISKDIEGTDDDVNESNDEFEDNFDPADYIIYSKVLKFKKNKEQKALYCVKFFFDDSYIWVKPNDMHLLGKDECVAFLNSPGRKNKKLIPAYEMASKGSAATDVWDFVEYGSQGKPDEDEYVEDEFDGPKRSRRSARLLPTRSSSRQRQKKDVVEDEDTKPARRTRTRSKVSSTKEIDDNQVEAIEEPIQPRVKRARKETNQAKKKAPPKAIVAKKTKKPEVELYKYEDDEDWQIVGLGPQDLSIGKGLSSVIKRLSKKNFEKHSEMRLDLEDKLGAINKLLEVVLSKLAEKTPKNEKTIKTDLEVIIDEFDIALNTKGSKSEYLTVFNSNNQLIMNFRILFNLAKDFLVEWNLFEDFQSIFQSVYGCRFITDQVNWKTLEQITTEERELAELEGKEQAEIEERERKELERTDTEEKKNVDINQDI
ncbi:ISWI one complex protein 4 [Nakaseomyces bracarensis]|uniref:ISWI one complex protein 4 n=1 Tax=Nakaseomyces bracarensis TaxID=273131 RepID=A0ABR4NVM2_9SACH